jgi:hypothetical protein
LNGPFAFGTTNGPEIFHQTAIQVSDTAVCSRNALPQSLRSRLGARNLQFALKLHF